jgi:hypothetical protein
MQLVMLYSRILNRKIFGENNGEYFGVSFLRNDEPPFAIGKFSCAPNPSTSGQGVVGSRQKSLTTV